MIVTGNNVVAQLSGRRGASAQERLGASTKGRLGAWAKRCLGEGADACAQGRLGVKAIASALFLGFFLCSCITDYKAKGIQEVNNILVVEGIITEGESVFVLSRSLYLNENSTIFYENNAAIYVECDDGTRIRGEHDIENGNGRYTVQTGQLQLDRQYRLKIEMEEEDIESDGGMDEGWMKSPTKTFEYISDYSYPITTPEIDSVFWIKRDVGWPVTIYVATHDQENRVLYYRWSYKADWEINADIYYAEEEFYYPYRCWNQAKSLDLLLGSNEKTVFGKVTDKLVEMAPSNRQLSVLYRIDVKQNAISKRAYDYLTNIKKNTQQTGSIFAPIPSELRGNIVCVTDLSRPVIGYVDVSLTTESRLEIAQGDGAYEIVFTGWGCEAIPESALLDSFEMGIPVFYVPFFWMHYLDGSKDLYYILNRCVDCSLYGTTDKPDDWPF